MNPEVLAKLKELRSMLGAYQSYNFSVHLDPTGVSYTHTVTDAVGNSTTVSTREVNSPE